MNFLIQIIKKTTTPLLRDYKEISFLKNSLASSQKFVLNAQKRNQEILISNFTEYFPDYTVIHNPSDIPPNVPYILLDPLEGINNMQNGLPFFGITAIIHTPNKPTIGLISLPCLDYFISAQAGEPPLIENIKEGLKNKSKLSTASNLVLVNNVSNNLLTEFPNTSNIRALGSITYALLLMLQGKAGALVIDHANLMGIKICDLFVLNSGGFKTKTQDFYIYSNKKFS
ncbi:hypothetical protein phytr_1300 [Candidatus Phycorickettsia trachydisci]|uniref:Inositol monophosphatase n=1 Tax=Candidatus Phycorickettsia trachydisci TaxID=2115978 RepID=A0A2P1P740_9RICK|nr:inositol monophosphatase family protein [Candidatus Phycorickettsia trachydisci]AVP87090.1 hypothetical protein phytr_1300 [Candidatus Phycorickettsia trachydisci]